MIWIWELTPEKVAEHHLGAQFIVGGCSPDVNTDIFTFRLDLLPLEELAPLAGVAAVGIDRDHIGFGPVFCLKAVEDILKGDDPILEHPVPGVLTSMAGVVQGDVLAIIWVFLSRFSSVSDL